MPRLQAVETRDLFQQQNRRKEYHNQDKQAQGASFGGSFLVPEIDMIFGDGVGASLVVVMVVVAVVVVAVVAVVVVVVVKFHSPLPCFTDFQSQSRLHL